MKIRLEDIAAINQAIKHHSQNNTLDIVRVLHDMRAIEVAMPSSFLATTSFNPIYEDERATRLLVETAMITLDCNGYVIVDFPDSSFKKV